MVGIQELFEGTSKVTNSFSSPVVHRRSLLPPGYYLLIMIMSLLSLHDSSLSSDEKPKSLAQRLRLILKWLHLLYPTSPLHFLCFQPHQMSPSSFKATGSEPLLMLALCLECPSFPSFSPILQQPGCRSCFL